MERLPKDVRDNIENKLLADGLNINIRRFAYKEIDDVIGEYYQNMRIGNDFAPCVLHPLKVQPGGCRCFHDPDFEAKLVIVDDTQDSKEIRAGLDGQDKPFRVHAAGVPCKDVSSFGKGLADAGPCMVAQSVWLHERAALHEDMGFTECTYLWDPSCLCEKLPSHFEVHTALLDPYEHMGDGIRRTRRVTTSVNRATAHFVKTR